MSEELFTDEDAPVEVVRGMPAAKLSFRDWKWSHPHAFVGPSNSEGSLADWTALYDAKGDRAMSGMYQAICGSGGLRVFYNKAVEFFADPANNSTIQAITALLRTGPLKARVALADMAIAEGVKDHIPSIAAWASAKPDILQRLRAKGLI